ncbi:MAG: sigma-70 family RNA polymerase sigma factor, partial [Candidatus Latescibacteria bacterium]|nr:sigma-70 family RNA polymerase sigma factor [Candidatus Latescibacterota bacterium]
MDDIDLIKKALNGEKRAFETLICKYQDMVYDLAYHRLGQFADAQDVAQDVFLHAYQRLNDLREPDRFAGWLRGITNNLCKQHLRRKRTLYFTVLEDEKQLPSKNASPEDQAISRDTRQSVHSLLQKLSDKNRQVITLHYLKDLSDETIGQMLDLSPGTVRVRLHRAKQQLKTEMIDMVKDAFENNRLDTDFSERVMKRIGIVGAHAGDKNGSVWFSTEDNERFVIRMPNNDVWPIARGPKLSLKRKSTSYMVTTNEKDLNPIPTKQPPDFVKAILDEFNLTV